MRNSRPPWAETVFVWGVFWFVGLILIGAIIQVLAILFSAIQASP